MVKGGTQIILTAMFMKIVVTLGSGSTPLSSKLSSLLLESTEDPCAGLRFGVKGAVLLVFFL